MVDNDSTLADQQIAYFRQRCELYAPLIGGWPTQAQGEALQQARAGLLEDLSRARAFVQQHPQRPDGKVLCADLLRMAHNTEVPGAADEARALLTGVLETNPRNYEALVCIASLYVTAHPSLAAAAESYFTKALEIRGLHPDPLLYQGLAFAALGQRKIDAAIGHFRKYLELAPNDGRIAELARRLAESTPLTTKFVPLQKSATVEESKPAAVKPWWKVW
jgi:tetratricopeptide (TPR) repeat protein